MSGYKRYEVKAGILPAIAPPIGTKALLKALADMGFSDVEVHSTPQNLYGYQGDRRSEKAEVIIRRKYIGSASNDIGFKRRFDGTFEAIISDFDHTMFSQDWLNKLAQKYGYYILKSKGKVTKTTVAESSDAKTGTLEAVAGMVGKAFQAYQERQRKEQEAAEAKEKSIQQKINQIKAKSSSFSDQSKVIVKLPTLKNKPETQALASKDAQTRIEQLKARLPKIRLEYEALIEGKLLDPNTVLQAVQAAEKALSAKNLALAEVHLQALDDARIQAMQQSRSLWIDQLEYVQERLNTVTKHIPQNVAQELQASIDWAKTNYHQLADTDIETLHQEITAFENQAERIQSSAENLVSSWLQVGYIARILGNDDGDVVLEVETHEGANTQMRIQFYGQQIDLEGPPEESNSCAARTREAVQLFQAQGYLLGWTHLDGEPVPEELSDYNIGASSISTTTQNDVDDWDAETEDKSHFLLKSQRGIEGQRN